jgi:UDP-N-acetylmuramyl pentapeptide synthase
MKTSTPSRSSGRQSAARRFSRLETRVIASTLAEVADVVGGRLADADPAAVVTGPAVIDSREVEPGGLFAALVGAQADGHDYAAATVRSGAVAVLGTRPVGVPAVLVDKPPPGTAGPPCSASRRSPRPGSPRTCNCG